MCEVDQSPVAVRKLSDGELQRLSRQELPSELDARLSLLLSNQQAGTLTTDGCSELASLMRHDEVGMLQKSEALAEAARRKL